MRRISGFSLVEVVVALAILGIGMVGVIQLFPRGLEAAARAENETRAAILAQQILETLKTDPYDLNFVRDPVGNIGENFQDFGFPGNGFDDDQRMIEVPASLRGYDRNNNGLFDIDFDGGYRNRKSSEPTKRDTYNDNPTFYPSMGLSPYGFPGISSEFFFIGDYSKDGDPYYDPERSYGTVTVNVGIDEEYADGVDNDGDGLIDEDTTLAMNIVQNSFGTYPDPLAPGDGLDNDGDGEEGSPTREIRVYSPDPLQVPLKVTVKVADGVDNNGDGRIDEGIDEEIYNEIDNDGDGRLAEDCRMASYPFRPRRFPYPDDQFAWQIFAGRVADGGGDGLDNDFDGRIDEDPRDGIDNDGDGLVDEDPSPLPLPGFRRVMVRITWGGDGEDNDGDGIDFDGDGIVDQGYDEELADGLDNDYDGQIDEDTYESFYEVIGYIRLKDPRI